MKPNTVALMSMGTHPEVAKRVGSVFGGIATGLTATGSSSTDAYQLTKSVSVVGTTASSTGVILPKVAFDADAVDFVLIVNNGAQTLTIYPDSGSTVNATTSVSLATTKTALLFKTSATAWESVGLD